ncbi:hypothetical protein B0O80DRAFT_528664 [Mortierella sp. GBAus27b]|nr:hypothetical protein B0O80DRAFT_528664 [Mortierella sp. GBAus27b]
MQNHQQMSYRASEPRADSGPRCIQPPPTPYDQGHQVPIWDHPPRTCQPCAPYKAQVPSAQAHVPHQHCPPSYSAHALKTFAPQQMAYTPDAAMVPIHSLQPVKSFVRVSGRTVRALDVKAFSDKRDSGKQKWIQTFIIKDDHGTIEVKLWHKSKEHLDAYAFISLDQVVHVWTDEVKINTRPVTGSQTSNMPVTSSPFCLELTEGKVGHRVDLGSEAEMESLFKSALGINIGGVVPTISIKQVIGALGSIGNQRFNMIICIKQMISSSVINSKNGPLKKTLLTVFDAQGQEASLTLWGDRMAVESEKWVPLSTVLLLTGPQVTLFGLKPQITVGYQTHIQVDPACKNVEWLKHFVTQCSTLPSELNPIAAADSVTIDQIRTYHRIIDISAVATSLGTLELVYGKAFVILSELDIENLASDVLTAKCDSCKGAITSYKMDACPKCQIMPKSEDSWTYCLSRHISFMDHTAELYHPTIHSDVVQNLLGFKPNEFSALSMLERTQLKERHFLERFKIYYKISWSDFKKQRVINIMSLQPANLPELEDLNGEA